MNEKLKTFLKRAYLIVSVIVLISALYVVWYEHEVIKKHEQVKLYYGINSSGILEIPEGIYFKEDEYYCVWLKGKTIEDINNTEYHERCHHFVAMDYEHFCVEAFE